MNKKEILNLTKGELMLKLQANVFGLSAQEAEDRLKEYGPNTFGKKTVNAAKVLGRQLKSSLVYLLIVASIISYWIKDYSDGTIILAILLINTLLGFYQEYKSEKVIEKLSRFITNQILVKREDQNVLIDKSQIVVGDIVIVREGDIVPADIRLLESDNLQVNESQLTGESALLTKQLSIGQKTNENDLLFAGSTVEKGEGSGVVYATGKNTELGVIAKLATETKKQTQYEKSLKSFSSSLIRITLFGLGLIFVMKLILNGGFSHITELLLFIIATAVSVVPEVLPVIATVTMSVGALKLAKKHVVVKRLSSLEDLGNVNLLCTDKTGTITENKMAVNKVVAQDQDSLLKFAYASIVDLKGKKRRGQNSYDDAFLNYVSEHVRKEAERLSIIKELPFDPADKRRRVLLGDLKGHKHYLVVLGAPEVLLSFSHCEKKSEYLRSIKDEGKSGLHHLGLAYKEISYSRDFDILKNEHTLTFLGYVSLDDPLRPTAKNTISHAEKMGIKVKILTGDSKEVAEYIGGQIGLVSDGDKVYLGEELEKMTKDKFKEAVFSCNVFARVSPSQKFEIIKALKEKYVVGYQGDGINDAPALKLADVAIAVNSATDIAKENADIVLLNRSLEVIINGIHYGRSVFVNVNKYIKHTMVSNFANFIALSVLYLFSAQLPLLPVQVLLTSVVTDVPMIAISSDTVDDNEIIRPEKQNIKDIVGVPLILGIPSAILYIFYFLMIKNLSQGLVETSLYLFFTVTALVVFYSIRTKDKLWKAKRPSLLLNIVFFLAFIFSIAIIYLPPFKIWFSFTPLPAASLAIILILTAVYLFVIDIVKTWYYRYQDREIVVR